MLVIFIFETGPSYVTQAGLKPVIFLPQIAGITDDYSLESEILKC